MSASSPMVFIGKRFGLKWYFAGPEFTRPGIYVWLRKKNRRVLKLKEQRLFSTSEPRRRA